MYLNAYSPSSDLLLVLLQMAPAVIISAGANFGVGERISGRPNHCDRTPPARTCIH